MNKQSSKKIMLILSLVAGLSACSQVDPSAVGMRYSTGSIEGKSFEKVVEPGTTEFTVNDEVVQLPTSQRSYLVRKSKDADVNGVISVPASDGLLVDFETSASFVLNTRTNDIPDFEGGTLREFYERICRQDNCELTDEGKISDGWRTMLKKKFQPALESAFKDEARTFTGDAIVNNAPVTDEEGQPVLDKDGTPIGTLTLLQQRVGVRFLNYLTRQIGGQYFCGPSFDPTDKEAECPPVELIVTSADYNNPDVRKSREAKKVAADQSDAQSELQEALKDPNYVEYLKVQAYQACVESGNTICILGGSNNPPIALTPQQ